MDYMTKRALLRICELFNTRLDAPARTWVLARLTSDHQALLAEERRAA